MFFSKNRAPVACVPAAVLALLGGMSVGAMAQTDELEVVVVTATRTPVSQADVIGDVRVIDRETIEQSAGLTVGEILRQHGGVQITSNGGLGNSSSVFIRGTEARHVLLLIDGVRYGSATLGTPNWDNLPLSAIERIEVLRGPAASLYGSDAVGGVVQIFTRRGSDGVFSPYVSATLGSYGRRELSAGFSGGGREFSYSLGVGHVEEKGFSATNERAQFGNFNPDRDGFDQQSMHAHARWQVAPSIELGANLLLSSGDSQFDSSLNSSSNFDVRGLTTTRAVGLNAAKTWSTGGVTRLQFGTADDLTRNLYRTADTRFDTQRQQWTLQHNEPTPIGLAMFGVERTREEVSGTTSFDRPVRNIEGFFAGLQGRAHAHRWQMNVRYDDNSTYGSKTTGFLAYGYQLNNIVGLTASTGTFFKAPTFNQVHANASIKPESGQTYEVGVNFDFGTSRLDVVRFRTNADNLVNWVNISGVWTPSNVDLAVISGTSFDFSTTVSGWRFGGQLELLDARNKTPGNSFNRRLPRRADEQLTLNIEKAVSGWWLGANVLFVSDRYENADNTQRLPGFGTVGLTAERPLGQDWHFNVRVNNLGDKAYETVRGFNQPGRSIYTTLSWRPQR